MYETAVASAVPFQPYPRTDPLYAPPNGFPPGAAETMIGGGEPPLAVQHDILRRYGHISSRFDTIKGEHEGLAERWDTFKEGLAHGHADEWKRTIYDNEAGRAK